MPTNPAKYYRGLFIISEGYVHWIYGQVQYNTLNAALEAPDPTTPAGLAINPKSAAYIYQSGETALEVASSDRWIDRRPILAAGEGAVASGGGLANVVEDNTPQLGGDLDVNGNGIVSVSDGNINLAPDGTGEAQVGGVEIVTLSASQTLSNKTLVVPSIFDASADDRYIVVPGELTANRIILLPALTGNDTFVFATHAQTLANKTLTTPTIGSMTNAQHDHADAAGGGVLALQRPRATILRMTPPGTDFAYQVNITGNSTPAENYTVWAFAGDDSLILDIKGILSEDYAGGGLTVKLCISNQSADAGSEQTRWVGAFRRYEANAAPLTTLFNYVTNAQGVSIDVASAAGEPMYGEIVFTSGAQMNGLLFGEQFLFRLYRDDDHADDDPTDLAYLHGIEIRET